MSIEHRQITSRSEWLEWRMKYICASEVASICGEGLFESAAQVWARKKGMISPALENSAMKRGRWAEPAIFAALSEECPHLEVRRAKVFLVDNELRLAATPDGVAVDPAHNGIGIIQAKFISRTVFVRDWCDGVDDSDAPVTAPLGYQLQTLCEAMLADANWAIIAAIVHDAFNWQLQIVEVPRHTQAEAMIRNRVADFWDRYLDANICPPIDTARDHELVKKLFPCDDGSEVDLTRDNRILNLVDELAATKKSLKRFDQERIEIETEIKQKLGSATYGRLSDGRMISWKKTHCEGYYVKPREYRTLRITRR